jgi:shikimate dehydrogenase
MSRASYIAALVGAGIASSLTPPMHEREGARNGLNYIYRTIDISALHVAPETVGELVRAAMVLGFDGLNITHPCKQLVIPHLDDLAPEAAAVGAVNTVVFQNGRAIGHNTDVTGFAKSFAHGLPDAATGAVVQVGSGGAGSAVAHALLTLGADRLTLADLDTARAERLAARLADQFGPGRVRHVDPGQLDTAVDRADGVVNATPVGMAAHPGSAVPAELLRPGLWVADIVYRPVRTELVRAAEAAGCVVLNGAGMAVFQAVDAFALITGREPDAEAMFADFRELVALESLEGTT